MKLTLKQTDNKINLFLVAWDFSLFVEKYTIGFILGIVSILDERPYKTYKMKTVYIFLLHSPIELIIYHTTLKPAFCDPLNEG